MSELPFVISRVSPTKLLFAAPGERHTVVSFKSGAFICSCGESSETADGFFFKPVPSLRHGCTVCGTPSSTMIHEFDSWFCTSHANEFADWKDVNPKLPRIDYLREKLTS
jgi:hypothetical protein